MDYSESRKLSVVSWIILIVLIFVVVSFGFYYKDKFFGSKSVANGLTYQAVFLTNGQVYFGKISGIDKNFIVLKNIYYLQAVQPLQGESAQSQPFSLVKLGKELHGPTDVMYINMSQVLFYEDLREDSSVVKTIKESKI